MDDVKKEIISFQKEEIAKVERMVQDFCMKYRIYDEYFGVIMHSLDLILDQIIDQNAGFNGSLEICQRKEKQEVSYIISVEAANQIVFDIEELLNQHEALKMLPNEIQHEEGGLIAVKFYIDSIHHQESLRRKQLLFEYHLKSKAEAL